MKKSSIIILMSMLLNAISTVCYADVYAPTSIETFGIASVMLLYYTTSVMVVILILSLICGFIAKIFNIENLKEKTKVYNERLVYYIFLLIVLGVGSICAAVFSIMFFLMIVYMGAFFSLYNRLLKKDKHRAWIVLGIFLLACVTFCIWFVIFEKFM